MLSSYTYVLGIFLDYICTLVISSDPWNGHMQTNSLKKETKENAITRRMLLWVTTKLWVPDLECASHDSQGDFTIYGSGYSLTSHNTFQT